MDKDKKEVLMQPNTLIKSKYNFTSVENKVFYKMLFNAQKQHKYSNAYTVKITKDELRTFLKNNNDFQYSNIQAILEKFQQNVLKFQYIDEEDGRLKTFGGGLIQNYILDHAAHEYTIEIHEVLYKYITDSVKMRSTGHGYTAIDLSVFFNFKSIYAQRLYTLLRLWSRENVQTEVKFKLQDLRAYLDLSEDTYPEYKHFKQNILKRARDEINKKGKMKVEFGTEIRKNRKVDEVVFNVIDYEPRKYFENKQVVQIIEEEDVNIIDVPEDASEVEEVHELEVVVEDKEVSVIESSSNVVVNETKTTESKKEKTEEKKKLEEANVDEMYIPDKTIFTKGTLRSFKIDFADVDFSNENMKQAFDDTVAEIFEEFDVETIKVKIIYPAFRKALKENIEQLS